ncbi:MAG TPA: transposase [Candidatus Acidoferrales bacterium]|nr:transposase [Candidatus Acidoferrales bacterium]
MTFYRRNLPHWHPDSKALFITWRLHGSLPKPREFQADEDAFMEEDWIEVDAALDHAESGPLWLKDARIAALVVAAMEAGSAEFCRYDLHAYVVMANHVHMLLTPKTEVPKIARSLKGVTARAANLILRRTGKPFWQDESFDHWIRDDSDFTKNLHYIEHNPVAAGFAATPQDWPWSSARRGAPKS